MLFHDFIISHYQLLSFIPNSLVCNHIIYKIKTLWKLKIFHLSRPAKEAILAISQLMNEVLFYILSVPLHVYGVESRMCTEFSFIIKTKNESSWYTLM